MDKSRFFEKTDKDLISVFADDELNYWALKWGVSKETIKSAIKASGSNSVSKVYTYLANANKLKLS
ncbi:DUF3606 domain-containing protein [Pedobacter sp. P351]|uniref:DUF3606 domain-containing protein n=1 Tax=Pedobacter superstes TaxID=3133441 RepID=UPI0030B21055